MEAAPFLLILAYLGAVLAFFHQYKLLDARFEAFLAALSIGFAVHYRTPLRHKQAVFLLVSTASALILVPPTFIMALLVLACAFYCAMNFIQDRMWRAVVLGSFLLLPALFRAGIGHPTALHEDFWMYFGFLFMFRAYLYWLDSAPFKEGILDCLTYFFMAPAFVFPIFPVIDYRLFKRAKFNRPQHVSALTGIDWIFRGGAQLLAHRLVFSNVYTEPSHVTSVAGFILFSICSLSAILKVTGTFHIAIGVLHLFGFDLPRPSKNYFLSTSFLDFWTRSNFYWKNFMVKTVYMPLFLRFHARSAAAAAAIGGVATFITTWLLHVYQQFWLNGELRFSALDAAYWALMGGGVIISLLARSRSQYEVEASSAGSLENLIKVPVTFIAISLLWGLCAMPSFEGWWELVKRAL